MSSNIAPDQSTILSCPYKNALLSSLSIGVSTDSIKISTLGCLQFRQWASIFLDVGEVGTPKW